MDKITKLQTLITSISILLISAHIIWPDLKIDAITIALLVIAVTPWLAPLFKSLELPGGWKFEFNELQKATEEAEAIGLINDKKGKSTSNYSFVDFADSNPNLALAGLRMEIEKSLKLLAKKNNITISHHYGITGLMNDLSKANIISNYERSALADIIGSLNKAVHGEELDDRVINWIVNIGPQLLDSINDKIKK